MAEPITVPSVFLQSITSQLEEAVKAGAVIAKSSKEHRFCVACLFALLARGRIADGGFGWWKECVETITSGVLDLGEEMQPAVLPWLGESESAPAASLEEVQPFVDLMGDLESRRGLVFKMMHAVLSTTNYDARLRAVLARFIKVVLWDSHTCSEVALTAVDHSPPADNSEDGSHKEATDEHSAAVEAAVGAEVPTASPGEPGSELPPAAPAAASVAAKRAEAAKPPPVPAKAAKATTAPSSTGARKSSFMSRLFSKTEEAKPAPTKSGEAGDEQKKEEKEDHSAIRPTLHFCPVCVLLPAMEAVLVSAAQAALEAQHKSSKKMTRGRMLKIGGAVLVGGALVAITGGLAAPGIIGGIGALSAAGGVSGAAAGTVATVAATTVGTHALVTLLGMGGGSLAGWRMTRRTASVEVFRFEELAGAKSMHATILVAGWCVKGEETEFVDPWVHAEDGKPTCCETLPYDEKYAVVWCPKPLANLGESIRHIAVKAVADFAVGEFLKQTLLHTLLAAWTYPSYVVKALSCIDSPWTIGLDRADEAGHLLATVLLERKHGHRPVSLVGYSLGARMIFVCLEALADAGPKGQGLVDEAILLGAPVPTTSSRWKKARSVVSGRLVNGYSTHDWILKYVYRYNAMSRTVAGLTKVLPNTPDAVNDDEKPTEGEGAGEGEGEGEGEGQGAGVQCDDDEEKGDTGGTPDRDDEPEAAPAQPCAAPDGQVKAGSGSVRKSSTESWVVVGPGEAEEAAARPAEGACGEEPQSDSVPTPAASGLESGTGEACGDVPATSADSTEKPAKKRPKKASCEDHLEPHDLVENFDLSFVIHRHDQYAQHLAQILMHIRSGPSL